jgi:ribosomal protein L15
MAAPKTISKTQKKVYTITYGDVAENHARMQKIGHLHAEGYSLATLQAVQKRLLSEGVVSDLIPLHEVLFEEDRLEEAYVLVIRKGAQHILGTDSTVELMAENDALTMDKHALMRGRVVNKLARWNLCFADEDQEPLYEDGKGRIVAWRHIPLMQQIRLKIAEWTDDELLNGEANYYYDVSKCGIGYHGDGERKKVFAVRMGPAEGAMPLYYQWYYHSKKIGPRIQLDLCDGDMYMMSAKAVGFDWLKKNILTLRHATGCDKFTK